MERGRGRLMAARSRCRGRWSCRQRVRRTLRPAAHQWRLGHVALALLEIESGPAPPSASSCPESSEASPAQNGHLAIRCSKDVVSSS
jgi:hypothetical protein